MFDKQHIRPFVLLFILLIALLLRTSSVSTARSAYSDTELDDTHKINVGAQSSTLDNTHVLEYVGQTGGFTYDVAVQDNYAFVGEGPTLTILDITDPTEPSIVGKTDPMPETVQEIVVSGNHAYVAAGKAGLRIFDISNPTNPVEINAFDAVEDVRDIAIEGDYLYIADYKYGLRIIDISDLQNLTEVGFFAVSNYTNDVAISENQVMVANGSYGVRIVDVSDVSAPVEVGRFDSPGNAREVAVRGDYAYIADGESGLRIVDITNVGAPSEVGFYNTPSHLGDVSLSGSYAYIAESALEGLRVIDISTPEEPNEIAVYKADGYAYDVIVTGDVAYVAFGRGLHILDVENAEAPSAIGFYNSFKSAWDVAGAGYFAAVAAGWDGLILIDLANPSKPSKISSSPGYATGVAVQGDYAYVVSHLGGLRIVDISDPFYPIEVSFTATMGDSGTIDVSVADSFAYVAAGDEGLIIFDVSNPQNPVEAGRFEELALSVALSGDYAFATAYTNGTRIIDITDPANPFLVEHYATWSGSTSDVDVSGDYMYIAYGDDWGLEIVNISNPVEPVRVRFYNPEWTLDRVVVQDGLAYIPAEGFGLKTIDVSEPDSPREVASFDTSGSAKSVALNGTFAHVADGLGGFYNLRTNNVLENQSITIRKQATPADSTSFEFDGDLGRFYLKNSENRIYTELEAGDYTISESTFAKGLLDRIECDSAQVTVVENNGVTIHLQEGQNVSCTFYNTVYEPARADFNASPTSGKPPLIVDFTNLSTGDFDQCLWDFGDNNTSDICEDPSHTYEDSGIYTVSLKVAGLGGEDTFTKTDYITVYDPVKADFSASPTSGIPPLTVGFTNLSTGDYDQCLWDFGDDNTSQSCDPPSHTYITPGSFTVNLTVDGPGGADEVTRTDYITVYEPPIADFSASPDSGVPPLQVTFENLSTGDFDECLWDFGDSSTSNKCDSPSHTYDNSGVFTVSLKVQGSGGEDTTTKTDYMIVANPLKADFSASPESGAPPLKVTFENLSAGDYDECFWDFGDGWFGTSCDIETMTYRQEGQYAVSLTVKGPSGEDTMTVEDCVKVAYYRLYLPGVLQNK